MNMDMDMGGMDGMDGMDGSVSNMTMNAIFQTNIATPLYSAMWVPRSVAAYAGTCIFLIVMAASLRGLLALKSVQEQRWLDAELNRRYIVTAGKEGLAERLSKDSDARPIVVSENGVEENVVLVQRKRRLARPWRVSVDVPRAAIDVVIAGVGYLLMLAVMTLNVGYFMSILGGVFLGSVLVGRFTVTSEH